MVEQKSEMPTTILHLAVDYDNPHRGRPTVAIANFIHKLDFAQNLVLSMRRSSNPRYLFEKPSPFLALQNLPHVRVSNMTYFGLPGGVGLGSSMSLVARQLERLLKDEGLRPAVVHAHKLTFEGIAAFKISRAFKIGLLISIRGEVEEKILKYKPTYRRLLQSIVNRADRLYFVSAWFRTPMANWLKFPLEKTALLPNWVKNETKDIKVVPNTRSLVTILNLNDWRRKGLGNLLKAIGELRRQGEDVHVDIIGSGSSRNISAVRKLIRSQRLESVATLIGRMDNDTLLHELRYYSGLVLPSRSETFGMVYAEALFAGVPIAMNRGSGIDGYLENLNVAVLMEPGSIPSIKKAILILLRNNDTLRENISNARNEIFDRFSVDAAVAAYRDVLEGLEKRT